MNESSVGVLNGVESMGNTKIIKEEKICNMF